MNETASAVVVAIVTNPLPGCDDFWISNPDSVALLSVQFSVTCVGEFTAADKPDGIEGAAGGAEVGALTGPTDGEALVRLSARMR